MKLHHALLFSAAASASVTVPVAPVGTAPALPLGTPQPPPAYMVDNVNNLHGVAPDKGSMYGPVLRPLNASTYAAIHGSRANLSSRAVPPPVSGAAGKAQARATSSYWLASLGAAGQMPLAPTGYEFFRNVQDFGAVGDGVTDDTAAINRAIAYASPTDTTLRCGADCGSTTTLGALVYFPPGTYLVSSPLVMYYYTQMVGDPTTKPTLLGSSNFSGIALVDADMYIPGGNGDQWYINQSNFYRQVRNLVFDLTGMNWTNYDGDQQYVPTGIHWQVGQATSITNCDFKMAVSVAGQSATGVGIFMENGSGGFVSDLTFVGGNIGFRAGSQQFTATNLQFTSCLTAISMVWDWGFTWKNLYVLSCYIALDLTAYAGTPAQGTGSVSVVDSHFNGVPYAITVRGADPEPNIVLDNLLVENSAAVILVSGGATILAGSTDSLYFDSWAMGLQYTNADGTGSSQTGFVSPAPSKPAGLLDASTGRYFTRSKPQYETETPIVATDNGVSNANEGDQTDAINTLLADHVGSVIYFPAGIYLCSGTITVPVGSLIIGSGWSQIVAVGSYFEDETSPQVLVRVGAEGDTGIVEITDMLFTVRGPTAGAILVEWNVHESTQGSAAMWDSHFRVGGAEGSDLQLADCPTSQTSPSTSCMAASMLLHVTSTASGYFENVWAWVADHDLDNPANADAYETTDGIPRNVGTDISVYGARGILIESQGPTWFYASASEHSVLYQYQLSNASTIFLGHLQTETPYYQPTPVALDPFALGTTWPSDPTFADCADDDCQEAWALRIIYSDTVIIHSAGLYSFFSANTLGCADSESCQLRVLDTNFVSGLWLYNIFTKGNVQIVSPEGGLPAVLFNSTTTNGYTSEVAAWLVLAGSASGSLGNTGTLGNDTAGGSGSSSGDGIVYIDPSIWTQTSPVVQCQPPCTLVLPPVTLSTTTTVTFPPYTTSLEVGWTTTSTLTTEDITASVSTAAGGGVTTVLVTITSTAVLSFYTAVTVNTTLSIPAYVGTTIPVWNVNVTATTETASGSGSGSSSAAGFFIFPFSSVRPSPFVITDVDPDTTDEPSGATHPVNTRTITPPPYPYTSTRGSRDSSLPSLSFSVGPPKPTCLFGCGLPCLLFCNAPCLFCPPSGSGTPSDFLDSNDPDNDDNDSSSSSACSTATYSSCRTVCTASPSGCSSTCANVIGCDTTGTNIASTVTTVPAYEISDELWPTYSEDDAAWSSAALVAISHLSLLGDLTGLTSGAPSTSSAPSSTAVSSTKPSTVASTTTPTTATSTSPTSTPATSHIVYIEEYLEASDTFEIDQWYVYASTGGTVYVCDVLPVAEGAVGDSITFDAFDITGCEYNSAGTSDVGTMTCPGVDSIFCETDPQQGDHLLCPGEDAISITPVFRCYW